MFLGRYATRQGTYEVVTLVCRVVIPSLGGAWSLVVYDISVEPLKCARVNLLEPLWKRVHKSVRPIRSCRKKNYFSDINRNTTKRVRAGTKNSRPVGFLL